VLRTSWSASAFSVRPQWRRYVDSAHAYLECHIEQGPILARASRTSACHRVQAISWQELTITGKAAHAGTTPMHLRADAGVAAARINLRLRDMIASGRYGLAMRATMGAIVPHPGMVNIVPGRVVATVDLRNPSEENMRRAEADLLAFYPEVEREERVRIEWRQTARTEPVPFDTKIQDAIAEAAGALGLAHERIISGAGHDAQEFAISARRPWCSCRRVRRYQP
jgi:N-carbamoyl-L-amino-acid hydrolase